MRSRWFLGFAIALLVQILSVVALNWFDDWTLEEMPVRFVVTALVSGIAYLFAVRKFSILVNLRVQAIVFWTVAVVLRLALLPLTPGDDLWRYQWEGKIQRAGFNPYVYAPNDPILEPLRAEFEQWPKINHPEFRAIYPPGAEILFAGLSTISDRIWLYKLFFAAADLATIALLLLLLGGKSRYADVAWYAWNPLVVYSFAGAAHFDSLMLLPMTAAILLITRFEQSSDSRRRWHLALSASIALGLAISVKLVPLLLLLPCLFALGYRAVCLGVSIGIPALLSTVYGYPRIDIWQSLGDFAYVTRLNDLLWWLIEETVWPNPHQKNYHYNVILGISVALISLLFWRNWRRGMIWGLGTALILSPVLHPWYCTWILPLAAWRRTYAWFVFSITLFAYFLFWNERLFRLPWHSDPWMRALIIVPGLAAAIVLGLRERWKSGSE